MSEQTQRQATLKVYRGDKEKGDYQTYQVPVEAAWLYSMPFIIFSKTLIPS